MANARRFRPAGSGRASDAPIEYSPTGTGCPAIENALENLYAEQSEANYWSVMSAINYAFQLETRVLVPLLSSTNVYKATPRWAANPVPSRKAKGLDQWLLRDPKGRMWLPVFTSSAMVLAGAPTVGMPVAERSLRGRFDWAGSSDEVEGIVINPWGKSATFDKHAINSRVFLDYMGMADGGEILAEGRAAASAGDWSTAAEYFKKAAQKGSAAAMTELGKCYYSGRGVAKASRAEAKKLFARAKELGDINALIAEADCTAGRKNGAGEALEAYRCAAECAAANPHIEYTPLAYLRIIQAELMFISSERSRALAMAAEAKQGFKIRQKAGDPEAAEHLEEIGQITARLMHGGDVLANYRRPDFSAADENDDEIFDIFPRDFLRD